MDFREEMREAYFRALHGVLSVNGTEVPIFYDMVSKGQNPDVYALISTYSNAGDDTLQSLNRIYGTQFTIVVKNTNYPDNVTVDLLAKQFYEVVQPTKTETGINPNGFQIIYTRILNDLPRPVYYTDSGKIAVERVIQIENRINKI